MIARALRARSPVGTLPWLAALLLAALVLQACSRDPAPPAADTGPGADAGEPAWVAPLAASVEAIDRDTPGALGVYVRHLGDGGMLDHHSDRPWYLSSTIKVPVAIAVLQLADEEALSLDEELVLAETDFVDGAGDLLWQEPGARYAIGTLLEKSVRNSDSTATDMLIRRIGEDELNRRIQAWVPDGFGPVTTILQVRYDAYGLLHPGVAGLSNMDLVRLKNAAPGAERLQALATRLGADASDFALGSIEEAFERYYASGTNSATLQAFGRLLEQLVEGRLLSEAHTRLLLDHMQAITTGDDRIRAGLPDDADFAQKTGTQLDRACNVGIVGPDSDAALVVAACMEGFGEIAVAEAALRDVGAALDASGALQP